MKTAKAKRITPDDIGDSPILLLRANGYTIYFLKPSKKGTPIVHRKCLFNFNEARSQERFEEWKKKNGYATAAPTPNLPAVVEPVDSKIEKKRQQARDYYHNRKNGNGGGAAPPDKILIDRAVIEAVMQSLSSSLQSVAASVRILDTVLSQGGK